MKNKIYFSMANLYGWLIIILVGSLFVPMCIKDLATGRMVISATKILLLLFSFIWLYLRIVFQLKRNIIRHDYLFVFIIDAMYMTMFIYMNMYMYIDFLMFALISLFLIFLDFFIYAIKHIHIKNIFLYIISLLFLLIIDCIIFIYTSLFFLFLILF